MADAYACDLTGELFKGQPVVPAIVQLRDDLRLRILVDRRVTKTQWEQGQLGPAAIEKIGAALKKAKLSQPVEAGEG